MIRAYVPEADRLSFNEAICTAANRDIRAAAELEESAQTQLRLEKAVAVCNEALEVVFSDITIYQ